MSYRLPVSVGYILNVTREIDNFFPESFTYMNIRLYDVESSDLLPHWTDTYGFIEAARLFFFRFQFKSREVIADKHILKNIDTYIK